MQSIQPVGELLEDKPQALTWGESRETREQVVPNEKKLFRCEISEEKEENTYAASRQDHKERLTRGL